MIEQTFSDLAQRWSNETGHLSSLSTRMEHPAYQAIVSLGWEAVPLLLHAFKTIPDFWFPALRDITHENPVPPEHRGYYDKMANDWLEWGKEKGLIDE